jgi:hypothetical protein
MFRSIRILICLLCALPPAQAQPLSQRGFVDARAATFPQDAPNDPVNAVGDLLIREELFFKPLDRVQFAAGVDLRGSTHGQVDARARLDFGDRTALRPLLSVRRLSASWQRQWLTVEAGKQFVRWGKTDIVTPTDHFAPRDFVNVIDTELIGVTGIRAVVQGGQQTFEAVVVPRFTPSRAPLTNQRWSIVPQVPAGVRLVDGGVRFPERAQAGARWSHVGGALELSLSYFNGSNHLPNIEVHVPIVPGELIVTRVYPDIASYGAAAAVPTRWFTIKAESAYFTSSSRAADEYVLYVIQLERLVGEWVFVAGYAGEAVTQANAALAFAPDRGLTRAVVGRATYTIDVNRTAAVEAAVRQDGAGAYAKAELSAARGQHWRLTVAGAWIGGRDGDFLGQYRRNSHVSAAIRYSF